MRKLQGDNEAPAEGEVTFDFEVLLSEGEHLDKSPGFYVLEYLRMFLAVLGSISGGLY